MSEHLTLKWGTLKSWNIEGEAALAALQRYADGGMSMSAAMQRGTPEQKEALCDLIDAMGVDFVYSEWDGEKMSKEEAKRYVREYGRAAATSPPVPEDETT